MLVLITVAKEERKEGILKNWLVVYYYSFFPAWVIENKTTLAEVHAWDKSEGDHFNTNPIGSK